MAEIILTWNFHPNESAITLPMAEKIKPLLEKRGHKVRIEKIPIEYPKGSGERRVDFANWETRRLSASRLIMDMDSIVFQSRRDSKSSKICLSFIEGLRRENLNAIIIDMHSTPAEKMRKKQSIERRRESSIADLSKISRWRADRSELYMENSAQLMLYDRGTHYVVEMPAKYGKASSALRNRAGKENPFSEPYHYKQVDLKATKAANYLSQRVAEKLAHLINTTVMTDLGHFRKPRRPMFRQSKKPRGERPKYKPRAR